MYDIMINENVFFYIQDDTWSSEVQVGDMITTLEDLYHSTDGRDTEEGEDDPDLKDEALLKIDLHVSENIYCIPIALSSVQCCLH